VGKIRNATEWRKRKINEIFTKTSKMIWICTYSSTSGRSMPFWDL
jgi:hypothetical protein